MKLRVALFALSAITAIAAIAALPALAAAAAELPAPPSTAVEPLFVDGTPCTPDSTPVEAAAPAELGFEILFVSDLTLMPEPQSMGGCFCSGCIPPTGICQCYGGSGSCCANCCLGSGTC